MDLDVLREALAQHRDGVAGVHQYDELAAAARAVLDSEEAWECGTYSTVHFDENLEDNGSCSHCRSAAVMAGCGPVFVVRVRLLAEEGT